ncbi:hypothetical protein [Falsiroseomonas sp. CW058]|uniref:hypothetical protein n=1 Tax=Falsiroseomonas sp. CW058 TaxID=3388664 RepID=UPI003D317804
MPDDTPRKTEVGRSPGYIPRPPSKEDVEKVSEQQGMITDEWAPAPTEGTKAEGDTEGQPG